MENNAIIVMSWLFISCLSVPLARGASHDFTELVLQRFYYVQRLERASKLLKELEATTPQPPSSWSLTADLFPEFTHPLVHEAINTLLTTRRLGPLIILGEALRTYRYLGDDHLIREFCYALLITTHTLMASHPPHDTAHLCKQFCRSGEPPVALIVERFYLIQRLSRAARLCCLIERMALAPSSTDRHVPDEIIGSVLDELWRDFASYVCIDDLSYPHRLCTYLVHTLSQWSHDPIVAVPVLAEDPSLDVLEETLAVIDQLTDVMEPVFEQYLLEKHSWWQELWERMRSWFTGRLDHLPKERP